MRRRDENGAVIPIMAVMVTVLLLIAAMAVDLGMQRVARRDMQALADVVAMDLARLLDGRSAAQIKAGSGGKTALEAAKAASFARNNDSTLGEAPTGCADGACVRAYLVDLDLFGKYPMANGVPVQVADAAVPDGVVVQADTEVAFAFAGIVGVDEGAVTRRALGIAKSSACIQLGSYAASINPSSSALFKDLLTPLLGSSTLNAVGYNGLASADISILDLISAPSIGVGTVDELLALPSITAGDVFLAGAHALQSQGRVAEAAVLTQASTSVVAPIVLDMGDLFGLDASSSDAVLDTRLNALDLLIGSAFLANGENFLNLPNLQAGLSSIGVTNTELKLIEKPRRHCLGWSADAETSQISLKSTIKAEPNNSPLVNTARSLLRLVNASTGTPDASIDLSLNVQLAGAHGRLTSASCDPDVFDFDVWTNLMTLSLAGSATVKGSISATVLGLANTDIPVQFNISVAATANQPASTNPTHGQLSIPPKTYADFFSVGSGDHVLPNVSVTMAPGTLVVGPLTVSVLGIPVTVPTQDLLALVNPVISDLFTPTGALVTRIVPIVQPLVDKVNGILMQLNTALGMNLGGADVYPLPVPQCNQPSLHG